MRMKTEFFLPMIPPTCTDWRSIPGFGDKYQVSNTGLVRNAVTGKVLTPIRKYDGYLVVNLSDRRKVKQIMVHRLVAETFIPNPERLEVVNHIDGNKGNPEVENLEWVTFSENSKHAYRIGLSHISEKCRKAASRIAAENGAKTTCKAVMQRDNSGQLIRKFPSVREAERITGVPRSGIIRACKSKMFSAGGFRWTKS
jgi:hypothetical protein